MFFIIESKMEKGNIMPAQSFGYDAIDVIGYYNWFDHGHFKTEHDYVLSIGERGKFDREYLDAKYTPIGSVEYVLGWLEGMGITGVRPLNIPEELWGFCKRKITIDYLYNLSNRWFVKSVDKIKDVDNKMLNLSRNNNMNNDQKYFCTEKVDDIISEWRVFVLGKEIKSIKNYSGDEWIMPDKGYIEDIIKFYDKESYVLDVMVRGLELSTDIVELHDFFSCGLYGFNDYSVIGRMWRLTILDLLEINKKRVESK